MKGSTVNMTNIKSTRFHFYLSNQLKTENLFFQTPFLIREKIQRSLAKLKTRSSHSSRKALPVAPKSPCRLPPPLSPAHALPRGPLFTQNLLPSLVSCVPSNWNPLFPPSLGSPPNKSHNSGPINNVPYSIHPHLFPDLV